MSRHPHADLIHAWAEGAEIEGKPDHDDLWLELNDPSWHRDWDYRIKPKEPEWYEDIPIHGVLCWVSDDEKVPDGRNCCGCVRAIYEYEDSDSFPFSSFRYATPLTNEEIKQFLRGEE